MITLGYLAAGGLNLIWCVWGLAAGDSGGLYPLLPPGSHALIAAVFIGMAYGLERRETAIFKGQTPPRWLRWISTLLVPLLMLAVVGGLWWTFRFVLPAGTVLGPGAQTRMIPGRGGPVDPGISSNIVVPGRLLRAAGTPGDRPEGMFRVAAIQFHSEFGAVTSNRAELAKLIREAAGCQAQIVVLPEAAVPGYLSDDLQTSWRDPIRRPNPKDGRSLVEAGVAETVPGPSTEFFGLLAKELKLYLVITLIERPSHEGGVDYFNTAVLLGPDGAIRAHYRKRNPWPIGEATWAQRGDKGFAVVETEYGRLGLLICYDLSCGVPEKLKELGVTTALFPIGWVCSNGEDWFESLLPEKVANWGLNLVGANWSLPEETASRAEWQGHGHSRIIRADGRILARGAAAGDDILYADLRIPDR